MCLPLVGAPGREDQYMTTASLTDTDSRVRLAVLRQLEWDPEVDAGAVAVAVTDSIVTSMRATLNPRFAR